MKIINCHKENDLSLYSINCDYKFHNKMTLIFGYEKMHVIIDNNPHYLISYVKYISIKHVYLK